MFQLVFVATLLLALGFQQARAETCSEADFQRHIDGLPRYFSLGKNESKFEAFARLLGCTPSLTSFASDVIGSPLLDMHGRSQGTIVSVDLEKPINKIQFLVKDFAATVPYAISLDDILTTRSGFVLDNKGSEKLASTRLASIPTLEGYQTFWEGQKSLFPPSQTRAAALVGKEITGESGMPKGAVEAFAISTTNGEVESIIKPLGPEPKIAVAVPSAFIFDRPGEASVGVSTEAQLSSWNDKLFWGSWFSWNFHNLIDPPDQRIVLDATSEPAGADLVVDNRTANKTEAREVVLIADLPTIEIVLKGYQVCSYDDGRHLEEATDEGIQLQFFCKLEPINVNPKP